MFLAVPRQARFDTRGNSMRVHIGTDHAGFELKQHLVTWLRERGYEVVDHGPAAYDPNDDYPGFCIACAEGVMADAGSLGIVLGGSGNGEQIAANKVKGVRAALVWNEEIASLARLHNNANVISIGARQHSVEECERFVEVFLTTDFSGEERHSRRIGQLSDYVNQR